METNNRTKKLLILLFILSLIFSGILLVKYKSNQAKAVKEKSVLNTEKQLLKESNMELLVQKQKLTNTNFEQLKQIDDLVKQIEMKNNEIQRLTADNAKVQSLRKKVKELESLKNELKGALELLKKDFDNISYNNSVLESDNQTLITENERLKSEIMLANSLKPNDFLLKSIKGNQKITAWARWTKVISLSFDFPEKYINELEVIISTPNGKTYTTANKDLVSITPSKEPAGFYPTGITAKRMDITLKPEKKFTKGIYKFTILKSTETVATMQFQLK